MDQRFKAVSDPTRRKILDLLQAGEMSQGEITIACKSTKPNISQHLNVLKEAGLVQSEKKGLYVFYSLQREETQRSTKEVKQMTSIKDKILDDIKKVAEQKKCESIMGMDSQDEGTIYIMKEAATLLSFHYSFLLSSFHIEFEIPTGMEKLKIEYTDENKIEHLLKIIKNEIEKNMFKTYKKESIKKSLHKRIVDHIEGQMGDDIFLTEDLHIIEMIEYLIEQYLLDHQEKLQASEQEVLVEEVVAHLTSFGILHNLMCDPDVDKIVVLKPDYIWIEKLDGYQNSGLQFGSQHELQKLCHKMTSFAGKTLSEEQPVVTFTLQNRYKVQITLPPVSIDGIQLVIKKIKSYTLEELSGHNFATHEVMQFLSEAVRASANIIISGMIGTGKTTLLEALCNEIPPDQKILTLEEVPELQLKQKHVMRLNHCLDTGPGLEESIIVSNGFNERVVATEIRGNQIWQFLRWISIGCSIGMADMFATSADNAIEKLTLLCQENPASDDKKARTYIGNGINLVVHVERQRNGGRRITEIKQVIGTNEKNSALVTSTLYQFDKGNQVLYRTDHEIKGRLEKKMKKDND